MVSISTGRPFISSRVETRNGTTCRERSCAPFASTQGRKASAARDGAGVRTAEFIMRILNNVDEVGEALYPIFWLTTLHLYLIHSGNGRACKWPDWSSRHHGCAQTFLRWCVWYVTVEQREIWTSGDKCEAEFSVC